VLGDWIVDTVDALWSAGETVLTLGFSWSLRVASYVDTLARCLHNLMYSAIEVIDHLSECNRIADSLRVFRVRNLGPGLVSPGRERAPGAGGGDVSDAVMGGLPAVTDVANR
jgi:hypothetical protein